MSLIHKYRSAAEAQQVRMHAASCAARVMASVSMQCVDTSDVSIASLEIAAAFEGYIAHGAERMMDHIMAWDAKPSPKLATVVQLKVVE